MPLVTPSTTVAGISTPSASPPVSRRAPCATASCTSAWTCSTVRRSTTAPSGARPSRGSPATSVAALARNFSRKASATDSTTMIRSVDMHIWPWLKKAPKAAAFTASSRSASSSTSSGALPPSSSRTGFRLRAARSAMIRPTLVEPVKLMRRTAGWSISAPTTSPASSGALVTRLTVPGGMPASSSASTISAWVRGQVSEAFSTTVLPQASGVAMARVARITGAFQGAMPSTTPAGSRMAMDRQPGLSDGITSPATCVVSAAASRSIPAASMTLKRAQLSVAPVSSIIAVTNSPAFAATASADFSSSRRRAPGPIPAQSGRAFAAASAASRASAACAATARVAASPVTGLRRSNHRPSAACLFSPAIRRNTASLRCISTSP